MKVVNHDGLIRDIRSGNVPTADKVAALCDLLGLEFYIGPPRSAPEPAGFAEAAAAFDLGQPADTGFAALSGQPPVDAPYMLRLGYDADACAPNGSWLIVDPTSDAPTDLLCLRDRDGRAAIGRALGDPGGDWLALTFGPDGARQQLRRAALASIAPVTWIGRDRLPGQLGAATHQAIRTAAALSDLAREIETAQRALDAARRISRNLAGRGR